LSKTGGISRRLWFFVTESSGKIQITKYSQGRVHRSSNTCWPLFNLWFAPPCYLHHVIFSLSAVWPQNVVDVKTWGFGQLPQNEVSPSCISNVTKYMCTVPISWPLNCTVDLCTQNNKNLLYERGMEGQLLRNEMCLSCLPNVALDL